MRIDSVKRPTERDKPRIHVTDDSPLRIHRKPNGDVHIEADGGTTADPRTFRIRLLSRDVAGLNGADLPAAPPLALCGDPRVRPDGRVRHGCITEADKRWRDREIARQGGHCCGYVDEFGVHHTCVGGGIPLRDRKGRPQGHKEHILPLVPTGPNRPAGTNDYGNLQYPCVLCHGEKTRDENDRRRANRRRDADDGD